MLTLLLLTSSSTVTAASNNHHRRVPSSPLSFVHVTRLRGRRLLPPLLDDGTICCCCCCCCLQWSDHPRQDDAITRRRISCRQRIKFGSVMLHASSSSSNDIASNSLCNVSISTSTSGDEHHRVSLMTSTNDHALVVSDGYKLSRRTRKNRHNRRNYRTDHK